MCWLHSNLPNAYIRSNYFKFQRVSRRSSLLFQKNERTLRSVGYHLPSVHDKISRSISSTFNTSEFVEASARKTRKLRGRVGKDGMLPDLHKRFHPFRKIPARRSYSNIWTAPNMQISVVAGYRRRIRLIQQILTFSSPVPLD